MLLERTKAEGERVEQGSVTLVGAGPGDPELLTLRAVRALQSADVILFDDLVSIEVLDFARREARKLLVGKTAEGSGGHAGDRRVDGGPRQIRPPRRAAQGRRTASSAEMELEACRKAGISVEVVPGVTDPAARVPDAVQRVA